MSSLPTRLRIAREQAGLSLAQAARVLQMNSSDLRRMEEGSGDIDDDALARFAEIYEVSQDWLSGLPVDNRAAARRVQIAARQIAHVRSQDLHKVLEFLETV